MLEKCTHIQGAAAPLSGEPMLVTSEKAELWPHNLVPVAELAASFRLIIECHYYAVKETPPPGVGVTASWPEIADGIGILRALGGASGASRDGGSGFSRLGGVETGTSFNSSASLRDA